MLTRLKLSNIPQGEIFASGEIENSPDGLYMVNSNIGRKLLWIAKKGYGYNDWAIYCHWLENGIEYIKEYGDKVISKENIQKLVPCEEDVYQLYRR
jgi:hypothetical protein